MKLLCLVFFASTVLGQIHVGSNSSHVMKMNRTEERTVVRVAEGKNCTIDSECDNLKFGDCWWAQYKCEEKGGLRVGAPACPQCDAEGLYVPLRLQPSTG
jgi:hypothetical protein